MTLPARTWIWLTVMTAGLLASFSRAEAPQQNHIPALLQFAEKYQEKAGSLPQEEPSKPPVSSPDPTRRTAPPVRTSPRPGNWSINAKEVATLRATITQLTQEVGALKKQLRQSNEVKPFVPPDLKGVRAMGREFRHALAITPDELQAARKLELANQEVAAAVKKEETLRDELAHVKEQNSTMAARLELMKGESQQHAVAQAEALKQLQEKSSKEIDELKTALTVAKKEVLLPALGSDKLNTEKTRQDYAAGISLGEEILQMQEERYHWGIDTDKQLILAGIVDTFNGRRRLDDEVLNAALLAAEKELSKAREETLLHQHKTDDNFLNTFKNRKAVKHTESGFWYQVDYEGDSAIPADAIVDVVVKEMLTDGTVIQDMETSGATLSQKIADFPPLFKEALSLLKNHGSMTMVIPPALAYGEKGYPPRVPPDATMVYQLRIAEVYPEGTKIAEHQPES